MRHINDTRLDIGRAVEDLSGHVSRRCQNDEFVEDTDAGELPGQPFRDILAKIWLDTVEERADEGNLE